METKKTVATITYHRSDNFGSVLQAYALGEKLRQMGYEQFVIDYRKAEVAKNYRILQPLNSAFHLVTDCYCLLHYGALKRRKNRYEQFRRQRLRLSRVYENKQVLMDEPPVAEVYITGSDQVWHTGILDFDESYLLDFVREGRKLSYAASGIKKNTDEAGVALIKQHIGSFDAVSVRENIARQKLEGKATVCIDPVLLLEKEDWEKLCRPQKQKKPYMFCYFAGVVSADFEMFTREKAKELGLERVILMPEWRNLLRPGKYRYEAGPEEFVSLLQGADLVCTNSFHGTAFSVLLNKPFILGQAEPFADDRIATLLGTMGLEDREIDPGSGVSPKDLLSVEFSKANEVLAQLRRRDTQWLRTAIEGEKHEYKQCKRSAVQRLRRLCGALPGGVYPAGTGFTRLL